MDNNLNARLLVSVIIPTFNRQNFIEDTIYSVINQTYLNWELILVDDGSKDKTIEIIEKFIIDEKRIKFFKRERLPKGANTCRNVGIEKANGKYIIFLDSDDLLNSFCLKQRVAQINKYPKYDLLIFQMICFNSIKNDAKLLWNISSYENDLSRFVKLDSVWHTTGPIWKKKAILNIEGFDEKLSCWQDVDVHISALLNELQYLKFFNFLSIKKNDEAFTPSVSEFATVTREPLGVVGLITPWNDPMVVSVWKLVFMIPIRHQMKL